MTVDDDSLALLPLAGLRDLRSTLKREELRVSYWRRLVQGRLDLIHVALGGGHPSAADVEGRRGGADVPQGGGRSARPADSPVVDSESPVAVVEALWDEPVQWDDRGELVAMRARLATVEGQLSEFRHLLHRRMDACSAEIVSRYQRDPSQIPSQSPDDQVSLSGRAGNGRS